MKKWSRKEEEEEEEEMSSEGAERIWRKKDERKGERKTAGKWKENEEWEEKEREESN